MALSSDTQPSADTHPSTNTQSSTSIQSSTNTEPSANTQASLHTSNSSPAPVASMGAVSDLSASPGSSFDHVPATPEGSETAGGASGQTSSRPRPKKSAPGARDKTRKRVSASSPQGRKRHTKSDVIEAFNESEKRMRPVPPRDPGPSTARPLPGTQPLW
ncbi:hypothetical protein CMUS01_16463 [Colletotrichum musicola]|uniref:Uncharacterized protein n=1 Tax=Colletotrichum musicola TaxID=2175873 RepID=A0A8H6IMZ0_9PEZI|nr:hypothetical protein CMUS01_16463 [Colletotrichum musicola]